MINKPTYLYILDDIIDLKVEIFYKEGEKEFKGHLARGLFGVYTYIGILKATKKPIYQFYNESFLNEGGKVGMDWFLVLDTDDYWKVVVIIPSFTY